MCANKIQLLLVTGSNDEHSKKEFIIFFYNHFITIDTVLRKHLYNFLVSIQISH